MSQDKPTSPMKAIRQKCLDCVYDDVNEVRLCPAVSCPLYEFRFGKNPYHKRVLSDEEKARRTEILKQASGRRKDIVKETQNV